MVFEGKAEDPIFSFSFGIISFFCGKFSFSLFRKLQQAYL